MPSAADLSTLAGITRRGFTGHEHLDAVGLIHMNGRVYDPVAGRFLGVDPIIELGNSQSVNGYSYVWNNPLSLIDPSGFQAAPPDVVTQGQPSPRNLCPYRIANIGMRCEYRYGWRWDRDPYELWMLDEYRVELWVRSREAQGGLAGQQPGSAPSAPDAEEPKVGRFFFMDKQFWIDIGNNAIQEVVLDPIESAEAAYEACTTGSGRKCAWDVANVLCEMIKTCDAVRSLKKAGKTVREMVEDSRVGRRALHGNKVDDRPATLYEKYDKDGKFLKHGVTKHEDPTKRYSSGEIDGGTVVRTDRGPRSEMIRKERDLVETNPGPDNREPWAGKRKSQ